MIYLVAVVVLEVLGLLLVVVPFFRAARRGWDQFDGELARRGGPPVIGRDVPVAGTKEDERR